MNYTLHGSRRRRLKYNYLTLKKKTTDYNENNIISLSLLPTRGRYPSGYC